MAEPLSIDHPPTAAGPLPAYAVRFRRSHRWFIWTVFLLSLVHRIVGLGIVPAPGETNDEISHVWAGITLLAGEAPKSWTQLNVPPGYVVGHLDGSYHGYSVVQPSFDHPPLFHLLSGTAAKLAGAESYAARLDSPDSTTTLWRVDIARLRWLSILLYAVTFWIMWRWLRLALGPAGACVAMVLFAFLQNAVIHHRLALSDNLVTPLFLGIMLCLERWRRGIIMPRKAMLNMSACLALAVATKLIALAIIPAIVAWSASVKRGRAALQPILWSAAGAAIGIAIILAYAAAYGFDAFLQTMHAQSGRFYDIGAIFDLVRHQPLVHTGAISEWIVSAWLLVIFGLATARSGRRGIFAALLGYLVGYTFFVPVDYYGWYLVPMLPFLCAAWGHALRSAWRCPQVLTSAFATLLLAAAALNPILANTPDLRSLIRYAYVVLAVLMLFPWGFSFDPRRRQVIRAAIIALLLIGLSQEITQLIALQLHTE